MRGAASRGLSALVYRSRAARALSPRELADLTRVAQRRNGRENVTGLMLYDTERFYQWLEGPPDSVNRVMDSIRNDHRHTDIETLIVQPQTIRRFPDWHMKLATPGPVGDALRREVIQPPAEIMEGLRARPEAAPSLLVKMVPAPHAVPDLPAADMLANIPLKRGMADILRGVFLAAVLPQLADGLGIHSPQTGPQPDPRAAELADLLVATDPHAAVQLVEQLHSKAGTIGTLSAALLEPAARKLGDLWSEDLCSEFDVTLGLCRLQTATRLLSPTTLAPFAAHTKRPNVLIAPEPGELHRLGAALDGTVLRDAGWAPHVEYPIDDNALDDLLAARWFDVLDLSLSPAFRRDQSLPGLSRTIAQARRASRNPQLLVVVGGRVFKEEKNAGNSVGADQAMTTAFDVNRTILRSLVTRSETPSVMASVA